MFHSITIVIYLGIVDKLLTEFERKVLSSEKAGKKFMDMLLKKVNLLFYFNTELG